MTPIRILGLVLMFGLIGLAFSPLGRAERRPASPSVHLTYPQPDGNRWVQGQGTIPKVRVVDIPLRGQPAWLVAGPMPEGSVWVSVTQEGAVQAVYVRDTHVEALALSPSRLPAGMPPVLIIEKGRPQLLTAPIPTASALTHPVRPGATQLVLIDASHQLVFWRQGAITRLPVGALLDARILADPLGRLLLLTVPTTRYAHSVLGDGVEAASITLVNAGPVPRVLQTIELPEPVVVEGLAPIWADLTGDGKRDIIVTLSDPQQGARLAVFDEAGQPIAMGPPIGQGYRWRHQLAVAPLGPNGETELVAVRTPHIGGIVEFYRRDGRHLHLVAQVLGSDGQSDEKTPSDAVSAGDFITVPMDGFNSHVLGSRNLDMAVAGDFDGDGRVEVLAPNQKRTVLAGIRRHATGASVVWSLPLEGPLSTNLATVSFPDGSLAIGAGHSGPGLRLWLPAPH